ncbi:MAG: hypothetical protein WD770_04135 [Actinomycetota bacterium]
MGTLILILLLLAALTGVFWTVVKVTAITVLSLIVTLVVLAYVGAWYVRRRFKRFVNDPVVQQRLRQYQAQPPAGGAVPARGRKEPDDTPDGPPPMLGPGDGAAR